MWGPALYWGIKTSVNIWKSKQQFWTVYANMLRHYNFPCKHQQKHGKLESVQLCDQPTSPLVLSWLPITAEQRSNPGSSRVSELNSKAKASKGSETRLNNHMHHPSIGAACDKNRVVKLQLCLKDVAATAECWERSGWSNYQRKQEAALSQCVRGVRHHHSLQTYLHLLVCLQILRNDRNFFDMMALLIHDCNSSKMFENMSTAFKKSL